MFQVWDINRKKEFELNIPKIATSILLGSAVIMSGVAFSAIPAQAATKTASTKTSLNTAPLVTAPGVSVGQVKSLTSTNSSNGTVKLSWRTPTHTGVVTGYIITVKQGSKVVQRHYTSNLGQTLKGLKKGSTYQVEVSANARSANSRSWVQNTRIMLVQG